MGAALHAASRDAGLDAAGTAFPAAAAVVVALVGVQLVRAPAWSPASSGPHARHGVQRGHQHHAVVPVGPAQGNAERRAAGIGDKMAFRARPAAIRRVRADLGAPFLPPGWRCRARPGSSPAVLRRSAAPAAPGAARPRPRRHATHRACASTSCRSSPVRQAPHATECRCAARTGSRPGPHGQGLAAARPSAWAAGAAAEARWLARDRQGQGVPCRSNASGRVLSPALSSTLAIRRPDKARRQCRCAGWAGVFACWRRGQR